MAGHGCIMFGRSWIEGSFLGSQVFGQVLMESCELSRIKKSFKNIKIEITVQI